MPGDTDRNVAIFGGGPAGLMAADVLSSAGFRVSLHEAMPTVGRKFLLAGKSGLNITHAENHETFTTRFGEAAARLRVALDGFPNAAVRALADSMGAETFVGTSGRIFPKAMKASPLLRAWLRRLVSQGVEIHSRHRWLGMDGPVHRISTPQGEIRVQPRAALLAFGGASWPRLGSDAGWIAPLSQLGVQIHPFRPANCGFDVPWSAHFVERFAGAPVKTVVASSVAGAFQGEFVISRTGIEGSLVYAHAAALRNEIDAGGLAELRVDLAPGRSLERLTADLRRQGSKLSFSNRLRKGAGLDSVKIALLRETVPDSPTRSPEALAATLKALPIRTGSPRPIAEAISSAGGVAWSAIDEGFMLKTVPGLFVAGEMIDWEAPTGGYLLTACLATGKTAAEGMIRFVEGAG